MCTRSGCQNFLKFGQINARNFVVARQTVGPFVWKVILLHTNRCHSNCVTSISIREIGSSKKFGRLRARYRLCQAFAVWIPDSGTLNGPRTGAANMAEDSDDFESFKMINGRGCVLWTKWWFTNWSETSGSDEARDSGLKATVVLRFSQPK